MKTKFEILEMNIIQTQVKNYCASTLGKNKVDSFDIFDDLEDLQESLSKVQEAMQLISYYGRLPLGGLSDIHMILEKARRDGTLFGEELLFVMNHLECVHSVYRYFESSEIELKTLKELNDGLVTNESLLHEIQKCILPDGSVSDSASPTLHGIRKKIQQTQDQIRSKMESLLKESKDALSIDSITTKNDRLVLPVKSGYKNQFGGLIHAQSATGQTTYIEPEAVMVMNNQVSDLRLAEQEEIERILYQLSQMIKNNYYHFHFNLEILEELDFIFAKAQYGYQHHCCIPTIHQEHHLSLKEARHPLIDETKVVANDIMLKDHHMLLISGSNTGGKTVTLKTVGLLSFMALCGMPIPCLEASIPLFDDIYVDLGDEQSIAQSLSTFSSHMSKIVDILKRVSNKSLVLLDEIGSGTDPQEGASLAEAILSRFLEIKCFVFASTHYGKLKTFAKENKDILLASVSFDLETMKPTYRLKLDSVGQSYAIEIASILGMSDDIIQHARDLKEASMSEHERLMEELEKKAEQISLKEEELQNLLIKNQKLEKQYQHQIHQIEHQKDLLIKKAQDEANQLIEEAKNNIDLVVETMKLSSLKQHEIIQAKHDLEQLQFIEKEEQIKQQHNLQVGDHVLVHKMKREGDIVEILNNHMIMVSLSGLNVKLHEDEVTFKHTKTKVKKVKKATIKKSTVTKTGTYEINVIGKRYEEAMAMVDKFLDDALVLGYPHVRIVHGMGTGVLRKGIRKMLDKNKNVISYRDGGPNEGGLGATLAYFTK